MINTLSMNKNIILASTSTLFGGAYLDYLTEELRVLYAGIDEVLFIPYARPSGISHQDYTRKAAEYFQKLSISIRGIHTCEDPLDAIRNAQAFFTGGGNTFLLVKTLHEEKLMNILKQEVESGKPYLGCSAGSNIGGQNMKTTNDMPIVYPSSFECMGLVPFNINPHYLDPDPDSTHNGETRETRIKEFLTQNDTSVVGLREGNWVRVAGEKITLEGSYTSRVFEKGKEPYEAPAGSEWHI